MSDPLTHVGIVTTVKDGEAMIAVATQGCSGCGRKTGCSIGRLAGDGRNTLVRVKATGGLRAGDAVTLSVGQDALNRAALLGYLLPAVLVVLGTVAGNSTGAGDAGAAAGALGGLVAALAALRIIPRIFRGAVAPLSLQRTQ